jgi:heterotetrameric sarcosine oxidase gamma subunit
MVDLPVRRSALAGLEAGGVRGAVGPDGPGVRLGEWRAASIVQVGAFGEAARVVSAIVEAIASLPVPLAGGRAEALQDTMRIFATGPGRVVVVARDDPDLEYTLVQRIGVDQASIVDLTHSRAVLRIAGPRARDVLAKGCAIDLHPRAFAANGFAQCKFGHLTVWLHQLDATPTFDLFVYRGFVRSLWEELRHGAQEYGASVGPL